MSSASALFQGCSNAIILQLPLQPQKIFQRVPVIGVNRGPLAELVRGIDRIKADGERSREMLRHCLLRQVAIPALLFGPVVVMFATSRMRSLRLNGISTPIHKQTKVVV